MIYRLSLLLVLLFSTPYLDAQNAWCGTIANEHDRTEESQQFESYYQSQLQNDRHKKATKYVIPIVFHIIHEGGSENISEEKLVNLVDQLNQDFSLRNKDTTRIQRPFKKYAADCEIEFRLAQVDPSQKCTNGITRTFSALTNNVRDFGGSNVKELIKWPVKNYLNVWIVKSIQSSGEGTTLGYAYYPGASARYDGIVLRYDQTNSNSLTHEIGHYLNLRHTFDNGCGGNCSTTGDRVCDTPPAKEANFGCKKGINTCQNDSPDKIDMIENYMDYSDCSAMFTFNQKTRMHSAIEYYRSELVSSANLKATGTDGTTPEVKPLANFNFEGSTICVGASIQLTNESCSYRNDDTYRWEISGSSTYISEEKSPSIQIDQAGKYNISLTVSNPLGSSTMTRNNILSVKESTSELKDGLAFDFNDWSTIEDKLFLNHTVNNFTWEVSPNGVDNSNCLVINNFDNKFPGYSANFTLPSIDLTSVDDLKLTYDLAYAQKDDLSNDGLKIYLSLDCGINWRLVKSDASRNLKTANSNTRNFVPNGSSDWQSKELDLTRYRDFEQVFIRFQFVSQGGNNLYIDNLGIGKAIVGIHSENITHGIEIFPNPSKEGGNFTLKYLGQDELQELTIYNSAGQTIFSAPDLDKNMTISTTSWPKGNYTIRLRSKTQVHTKRLLIN